MFTTSQWVHQHDALLAVSVALGFGLAALVRFRPRSVRVWALWAVAVGLGVIGSVAVRTPAASLSEHAVWGDEHAPDPDAPRRMAYQELQLGTVDDVRAMLRQGGKPTLVEVYSDWGFS